MWAGLLFHVDQTAAGDETSSEICRFDKNSLKQEKQHVTEHTAGRSKLVPVQLKRRAPRRHGDQPPGFWSKWRRLWKRKRPEKLPISPRATKRLLYSSLQQLHNCVLHLSLSQRRSCVPGPLEAPRRALEAPGRAPGLTGPTLLALGADLCHVSFPMRRDDSLIEVPNKLLLS